MKSAVCMMNVCSKCIRYSYPDSAAFEIPMETDWYDLIVHQLMQCRILQSILCSDSSSFVTVTTYTRRCMMHFVLKTLTNGLDELQTFCYVSIEFLTKHSRQNTLMFDMSQNAFSTFSTKHVVVRNSNEDDV